MLDLDTVPLHRPARPFAPSGNRDDMGAPWWPLAVAVLPAVAILTGAATVLAGLLQA